MMHMHRFLPCSQSQTPGLCDISEVKKNMLLGGEGKGEVGMALNSENPVFPVLLGVWSLCLTNCKYLLKTCL